MGDAGTGCGNFDLAGDNYNVCKELCTGASCNSKPIERTPSCYECTVTVNPHNDTIGIGDNHCWEKLTNDDLVNCDSGKCYTEITADWTPRGILEYTLTRACFDRRFEEPKPNIDCTNMDELDAFQRKSCKTLCSGEKCNEDWTELGEQLSGKKNVERCHACRYVEKDDGSVIGHKGCKDDTNHSRACPSYATNTCISTSNVHEKSNSASMHEGAEEVEEVYKACSPFAELEHCFHLDSGSSNGDLHLDVCKKSCDEDDCNDVTLHATTNHLR